MPSTGPNFGKWQLAQPMVLKVDSPALICAASLLSAALMTMGTGRFRNVVNKEVTFFLVHIKSCGGEPWQAGVSGLMTAGDLKPHFAGGRGEDEIVEGCRLCLPSEAADTSIIEATHPSLDARRAGGLSPGGGLDRLVRNRVDQARSEQSGWVSLGAPHGDETMAARHRLAPGVVSGIRAITVQHHAAGSFESLGESPSKAWGQFETGTGTGFGERLPCDTRTDRSRSPC